jgi:hypothetical protein
VEAGIGEVPTVGDGDSMPNAPKLLNTFDDPSPFPLKLTPVEDSPVGAGLSALPANRSISSSIGFLTVFPGAAGAEPDRLAGVFENDNEVEDMLMGSSSSKSKRFSAF